MKSIYRRPFMLLEVLIAFMLVAFCALPLIYPHIFILRHEKQFVATVELDHAVNLLYVEILQKLYQNEIPLSTILSKKAFTIEFSEFRSLNQEKPLPFTGTYQFEEEKHKSSSDHDHFVYLLKLIFTFTPKKGAFPKDQLVPEDYTYSYDLVIEQRRSA